LDELVAMQIIATLLYLSFSPKTSIDVYDNDLQKLGGSLSFDVHHPEFFCVAFLYHVPVGQAATTLITVSQ
jgi:hypothetical protein